MDSARTCRWRSGQRGRSPQPDPDRGGRARAPPRRDVVRHRPRPDRWHRRPRRRHVPVDHRDHVPLHASPGATTFIEVAVGSGAVGDAQRRAGRHSGWSAETGPDADRPRRGEHARRRRRRALLDHRPGPAPLARPGRQRGLPLQPVRDGRRAAGVRLLRPARPQERVHVARHRAGALDGRVQLAGRRYRRRATSRAPRPSTSSSRCGCRRTSPRSAPARTTRCARCTTASTWACSSASR